MKKLESKNSLVNKWVKFDPIKIPKTSEFSRIVEFYLFNSPVREINFYSAKTIVEYGWEKHKLSTLKKALLFEKVLHSNFFACQNSDEVELTILNNRVYGNQAKYEEIVIFLDNKKSIVESVLYLIRCAFAHRTFYISKLKNEKYYFMANVDKGKIKGRLVLKESTLLKWIDLIKNVQ